MRKGKTIGKNSKKKIQILQKSSAYDLSLTQNHIRTIFLLFTICSKSIHQRHLQLIQFLKPFAHLQLIGAAGHQLPPVGEQVVADF